ncbi:MAG: hypothetical protein PHN80_06235 [Hespellia sp.]|nr:hypothetical protein [Hespellia sp.]
MEALLKKFKFVKDLIAENENMKVAYAGQCELSARREAERDKAVEERNEAMAVACFLIEQPHMMFKDKSNRSFVVLDQLDIEKNQRKRLVQKMNFPRTSVSIYVE